MADITMCSGEGCPIKEKCYRYTAHKEEYQTMFIEPPIQDGKCEYLLESKNNGVDSDNNIG